MGRPKTSSQAPKPQAKWTEAQTASLLDSLLDGNRDNDSSDNNFPPSVWSKAETNLNDTFEINLNIGQLKNHYATLKRHYTLMRELKEGSGLGWSQAKDTVDGDENFWKGWIPGHKGSQIFKEHGFRYYEEMHALLGSTPISGANRTGTSTQKRKRKYSLTASEEALDNSEDEPLDGGEKGKGKVIDLAADPSEVEDSDLPDLPNLPLPPPLPPRPSDSAITSKPPTRSITISQLETSKVDQKGASTSKNPFTSSAHVPKPTPISTSKPSGSSKPPVNLATSLKLVTENSALKAQALIEKEDRKDTRANARAVALVEAARIKREALHPPPPQRYQPAAMERFRAGNQEHFPLTSDRIAAAKILRNEADAEFFLELDDDICFEWLLEAIAELKKKNQQAI